MKTIPSRKLNFLPLLTGAIALTLAVIPMISSHAQDAGAPPAPETPGVPPEHRGPFADINLTPEQRSKMDQIHQATRAKLDAVLTSDQKSQLENAGQQGQDPRQVFASLNLSADQKAKIREILESTRKQMDAVLTPDQLQQIRQHMPPRPPQDQQN